VAGAAGGPVAGQPAGSHRAVAGPHEAATVTASAPADCRGEQKERQLPRRTTVARRHWRAPMKRSPGWRAAGTTSAKP